MPNKLTIEQSKAFKKSYRKYRYNKAVLKELFYVLDLLQHRKALPEKYRDHELKGNFKSVRECHIKPDELLLYFIIEERVLKLVDIGSHAKLFGN